MEKLRTKNNKKYWQLLIAIVVIAVVIFIASYLQQNRDSLVQCDDFKDPMIWTTQDNLRNVSLHYEIKDVPKPSFDKTIRIFWGDGRSTKQSIGLGTSLSGSIDHKYSSGGDKKIEVFLSITNSGTECGLNTFVSL